MTDAENPQRISPYTDNKGMTTEEVNQEIRNGSTDCE
jgi:hypothetical protein